MRHTTKRKLVAVLGTVAFLLGGAAAVPGSTTASATGAGQAQDVEPDPSPSFVSQCNAFGEQLSNIVVLENEGTSIGETGFSTLPGSTLTFSIPASAGSSQVHVTFSAEAGLFGAPPTSVVPADFLQVQLLLDGQVMRPADDLAFTTYVGEAGSTQLCANVGAGSHTVSVRWRLVDQAANHTLRGVLDDWALNVRTTDFQ